MKQRAIPRGLVGLAFGMSGALATSAPIAREPMERLGEHPLAGRGWDLYLLGAIALLPVVVPSGPGGLAGVDVLNGAALAAFALVVGASGMRVELPFLLPAALIAAGSLLALFRAPSLPAGLAALVPELYLYTWLVMLVALLRARGGVAALQFVWLWTANAVALACLATWALRGGGSPLDLSSAGGPAAAATFAGAAMCADYLVVSVFVALGLEGYVRGRLLVPSLILLMLGLLATRSSSALIALGAGLLAWAAAGGVRRRATGTRLAGGIVLVLAACLVAWRAGAELHAAAAEPRNDFIAYASTRGPLALAGLVIAIAQAFAIVALSMRRQGGERRARTVSAVMRAALLGGLVAMTLHSAMIEKLHFRHDWAFLALIWATSARTLVRYSRSSHETTAAGVPRLPGVPTSGRAGPVSAPETAGAGS